MARIGNRKKRIGFSRAPIIRNPVVDHVTGDKIPKSFVFSRGKLSGSLKQLLKDLRELMLPYTALKLKEKKRNNLKDFLNVAGSLGVTHFMMTPQGPTLTFKIEEYSLSLDVAKSQKRPRRPPEIFKSPPLIVLSGFGTGEEHLKLTSIMFQNTFHLLISTLIVLLNYDKETKLIDFWHYSIRLQPVGVSRKLKNFVLNHQAPDLSNLRDVNDFVTKDGYGSESERGDEASTITLSSDLGRVNKASTKSVVRLIKIEAGLCAGGIIFSEYENENKAQNQDDEEGEDDEEGDDDEEGEEDS
ncbi:hypothetical protein MKW98_017073 [Papaver atlanticum]|uniref:Brix domain-containing protein n=1 Tax=Papaver atlanticum TaxID=357466 RepID=A0AAD4THQ7_9MAGN|nr:hypothetical protein MKW98_017073 [Papaver atlanticum]